MSNEQIKSTVALSNLNIAHGRLISAMGTPTERTMREEHEAAARDFREALGAEMAAR